LGWVGEWSLTLLKRIYPNYKRKVLWNPLTYGRV